MADKTAGRSASLTVDLRAALRAGWTESCWVVSKAVRWDNHWAEKKV
jgi:hypothetical protein